jgi:hypothetical protein
VIGLRRSSSGCEPGSESFRSLRSDLRRMHVLMCAVSNFDLVINGNDGGFVLEPREPFFFAAVVFQAV